jgi:hypothetical protein
MTAAPELTPVVAGGPLSAPPPAELPVVGPALGGGASVTGPSLVIRAPVASSSYPRSI